MSGELKITTDDGKTYWFGKDDHFPEQVRIYGEANHNHWTYLPLSQAREIVNEGLRGGGEVQQGDPVLFFDQEPHATTG